MRRVCLVHVTCRAFALSIPPPLSQTLPPSIHTVAVLLSPSLHEAEADVKDIRPPKAILNWTLVLINCHSHVTWAF